ncbi:hypothetical protein FRC02_005978 [Tulasnella sp. 418]|nr:hypothetical protein FRC02_005978 [Tulasnella sp. 418]
MDKKGRKFFQFSSKTKNIANETSGALVTTLTIVKESLDGVPIPGFKATVGGVLEVIKAVKKSKDNEEDIAQLRANVERLKEIIIEPLKNVEITDALRARIDVLMRDLEGIRTEFNKMSEKGHIRKFLAVHDHATTIAGLSRMLERALDSFMLGGAIEVERRIESVEQGVSKVEMMIEKFVLTQGQQELLNRLPSVDARYDSAARTIAPGCLEDTRVALLNEIFDWINDRNTREKIYWLYGLAGTGKSTIAQTVAARLDQESRLGASFFFSRDSKELRDPLRVLPTIACQLAELSPEFKRHLAVSLEGRKDAGTSALPIQMEKLIFDPLRAIEFSTFTLLVIVIDALDECEGVELTSVLLELISQFVVDLPNVEMKVFMTSRPEHHVMDKFKKNAMGPVSRPFALHDIEHSVVQADIQVFLRHELARLAHEFNIHDPLSPWPSEEDINELTARAGTLFIVASTGIKFIADPHVRHPKRQLRALLSDAPMSGTSPYRNLDQVYLCVLEAAVGNSKDPSDYVCCRLREVLGAIIIVLDPLSATALSHLTGLETDDIRATIHSE